MRTFISLPAGIARMNLGKFILYAFLGSFIWSTALAWGGYLLGQNWERLREVMRPFDYPILGIVRGLGHHGRLAALETPTPGLD